LLFDNIIFYFLIMPNFKKVLIEQCRRQKKQMTILAYKTDDENF